MEQKDIQRKFKTSQFEKVIKALRKRSNELRKLTRIIQVAIVGFIINGIFFFLNSDILIKRNVIEEASSPMRYEAVSAINLLRNDFKNIDQISYQQEAKLYIERIDNRTSRVNSYIDVVLKKLSSAKTTNTYNGQEMRIDSLSQLIKIQEWQSLREAIWTLKDDLGYLGDIEGHFDSEVNYNLEQATTRLDSLRGFLDSKFNKIESQALNSSNIIISASVIRIGIVLLLIFLVQILVSLYRYTYRLSAFYDARADALELLEPEEEITTETIEKIAVLLSPGNINFGKTPQSPTAQAIDIAKEIIISIK